MIYLQMDDFKREIENLDVKNLSSINVSSMSITYLKSPKFITLISSYIIAMNPEVFLHFFFLLILNFVLCC